MAHGAHTLGDDDHGLVGKLALKGMAQGRVGLVVECRERVIEDVEVRMTHERTGYGQALALAA